MSNIRFLDDKPAGAQSRFADIIEPDPVVNQVEFVDSGVVGPFFVLLAFVVIVGFCVGIGSLFRYWGVIVRRLRTVDWCRNIVCAVPSAWFGYFYGYYRYMYEMGVYSQQQVLRYTHSVRGDYYRVFESDRWDYSIAAGIAMFFSIWILWVVGARIARRARGRVL
jgi:hypothetical protein